jgi:hypothetical protein
MLKQSDQNKHVRKAIVRLSAIFQGLSPLLIISKTIRSPFREYQALNSHELGRQASDELSRDIFLRYWESSEPLLELVYVSLLSFNGQDPAWKKTRGISEACEIDQIIR